MPSSKGHAVTTTYAEMCCEVCGVPVSVAAMHRANPTGQKGRWRCAPCLGKPIDATVLAVTDAMQLGVNPHSLPGVEVVSYPPASATQVTP